MKRWSHGDSGKMQDLRKPLTLESDLSWPRGRQWREQVRQGCGWAGLVDLSAQPEALGTCYQHIQQEHVGKKFQEEKLFEEIYRNWAFPGELAGI